MVEDGRFLCPGGHVRYRFEPGSRVAFRREGNRVVLADCDDGIVVEGDWGAMYEFRLPADARRLLPGGDPLRCMLVGDDDRMELLPIRVEEHPADVLGPRVIDEVRRGRGNAPELVRHLVRGYRFEEWTPERLRDFEDLVGAFPLPRDPISTLAEGDDWVGWKTRNQILREPASGDDGLRRKLEDHFLEGQRGDGSWEDSPVRTAYAVLHALSVGVPPDDERLRRACEWLLAWPEPDGRPGMWMQEEKHLREWNHLLVTPDERPRAGMYFHEDAFTDADHDMYRSQEAQQVIPTCGRNFHAVCFGRMLHPSATVADALCRCGYGDHPRVCDYANTMLQVGGMFGYFCSCWGIVDYSEAVEDLEGAPPDFEQRSDERDVALNSLPYGYARDADDLTCLAGNPNYPRTHRPDLADTNGWVPYGWRETGADDHYAVVGAYWQNADCWAKTNRALAQLPAWPGTLQAFFGLFQCHLYQTSLGAWDQGYPAGVFRQIAEMTRLARQAANAAPELWLARVMLLKSIPWLREHQAEDGLWHHENLPRFEKGKLNNPPGPRLAGYHIASVLNEFGLLDRLRPH
jgi:hypothetical protein